MVTSSASFSLPPTLPPLSPLPSSFRHKRRKRAKYLNAASLMQRQASRSIHQRTSPSLDDSISSASSTLNPRHPVPSYGGAMTYYPSQVADQGDGSPSHTGGPMIPSSRSFGNGFQTSSNQVRLRHLRGIPMFVCFPCFLCVDLLHNLC